MKPARPGGSAPHETRTARVVFPEPDQKDPSLCSLRECRGNGLFHIAHCNIGRCSYRRCRCADKRKFLRDSCKSLKLAASDNCRWRCKCRWRNCTAARKRIARRLGTQQCRLVRRCRDRCLLRRSTSPCTVRLETRLEFVVPDYQRRIRSPTTKKPPPTRKRGCASFLQSWTTQIL